MNTILSFMLVLSMQHSQNTSQKETVKIRKDKQIIEGYWLHYLTVFVMGDYRTKDCNKDNVFLFQKNGIFFVSKINGMRGVSGKWEIIEDTLSLSLIYPGSIFNCSISCRRAYEESYESLIDKVRIEFLNDTLIVNSNSKIYGPIKDYYILTNK